MRQIQSPEASSRDRVDAAMERFIRRENIILYRALLADPGGDQARLDTIRQLLADAVARDQPEAPPRPR